MDQLAPEPDNRTEQERENPENSNGVENELKKEREFYVELAELLTVDRDADAASRVQKVLNSQWPVQEKIARIKKIDKKARERSEKKSQLYLLGRRRNEDVEYVDDKPGSAPVEYAQGSDYEEERRMISVNKNMIKRPYHKCGLMRYLFSELGGISSFAVRTGLLKTRWFPPRISLSRNAELFFLKRVRSLAKELIEPLAEVEHDGWIFLSKFRYNLVREFQTLCHKIVGLKYESNRSGEKSLLSKFFRLERHFLICHYQQDYSAIIEQSVYLVWKNSMKYREHAVGLRERVRELLHPAESGPSLYGLIQALQIVSMHRMVELEWVLNRGKGPIVYSGRFSCSREIERDIQQYCNQKEKSLQQLHLEYQRYERFRSFLEMTESGEPSPDPLEALICNLDGIIPMAGALEEQNMLRAAAWSCDRLYGLLQKVLSGTVLLDDGHSRELFDRDAFHQLLSELGGVNTGLDELHLKNRHILISRERLEGLIIKSGGFRGDDSRSEQETVEVLIRYSEVLYKIAEEMAPLVLQSGTAARDKAVELIELRRREFYIPYGGRSLMEPRPLQGFSIVDALRKTVAALYTGAWFFQNRRMTVLLHKQQQLQEEIRGVYALLERLTTAEELERIRTLYPMPF